MLHRGGTISGGRIIERKRDADDNHVGQANDNPIIDAWHYLVEFEDGKVTELTAKIIAESIYAMCHPEGERALLFYCTADFKRDINAMTLTDQKLFESR